MDYTSQSSAYSAGRTASAVTAATYATISTGQLGAYAAGRSIAPVAPTTYATINSTNPQYGAYLMGKSGGANIPVFNAEQPPTVNNGGYDVAANVPESPYGVAANAPQSPYQDALKRAYDLQRQQAMSEGEAARSAMLEQAKTRLSGAGINEDSGLFQKQLQKAETEAARQTAGKLGALDVAQLTTENNQQFQKELATLQNTFAEGRIRLEDSLQDDNGSAKAVSDSYYQRGLAGEEINASDLEQLRLSNPTAYYSYLNGKAGKSVDQNNKDFQDRIAFRNALILRLDPNDPNFVKQLSDAFKAGTEGFANFEATAPAPVKDGDTKVENGTKYEYYNGQWYPRGILDTNAPD